jgi:hypothetical protein
MNAAVAVVRIDGPVRHDLAGVVRLDQVGEHRPVNELSVRIESLQMSAGLSLAENRIRREGSRKSAEDHNSGNEEAIHGWLPVDTLMEEAAA